MLQHAPRMGIGRRLRSDEVAVKLDAAHECARRAYADRNVLGYMETFHPDLEYVQRDGRTIGRAQLATDVRSQLARVERATSDYRREALEVQNSREATEVLEQEATFAVSAFGVIHREWSVRRRGRYHWLQTNGAWQIRRVEVLSEQVTTTRTWLGFK
jgi:hypothetical protein